MNNPIFKVVGPITSLPANFIVNPKMELSGVKAITQISKVGKGHKINGTDNINIEVIPFQGNKVILDISEYEPGTGIGFNEIGTLLEGLEFKEVPRLTIHEMGMYTKNKIDIHDWVDKGAKINMHDINQIETSDKFHEQFESSSLLRNALRVRSLLNEGLRRIKPYMNDFLTPDEYVLLEDNKWLQHNFSVLEAKEINGTGEGNGLTREGANLLSNEIVKTERNLDLAIPRQHIELGIPNRGGHVACLYEMLRGGGCLAF